MKKMLFLLTIVFLMGSKSTIIEKDFLKAKIQEEDILLGKQNRESLTKAPYRSWFTSRYDTYDVDKEMLKTLTPLLKGIKVTIFMGTWCEDSKRETPHFYKIADATGLKDKNITLITMSQSKDTPEKYEKGLNITNVPTFIFYKNGKEINRIVEYPMESLEKDMVAILSGKAYKHAYSD
ncbi:thioredoxin family protein [Ascidiimonas aurantiaca]|uniref:thioredoxin family protein n=1 Tax=Ascidiimonas aurantiaca TaxID=1685432 RepID=UPI0030EC999C